MRLVKFTLFTAVLATIFSCSGVEEDKLPENVIKDDGGLVIELEWSTGGSVSQAQADADLELFLFKGDTEVDASVNYASFEQVELKDIYADDKYLITVEYYSGEVAVDYTIYVRGESTSESITYTGSFLSTDKGLIVEYLEIEKSGDEYAITDL
ncbi:hypothetical protein JKA74_12690 [Marivirga sp. S37H4]|uniref:Uncharacterized protein n=1 Tax=Marivirga aurantiaca TaxID=2802615 RepID=A0A934WZS8_9BACT|nr:hypothetical protein [Marivirga aurantiaca]MBK6265892.1 hypothetical protein [Marivirga aurantiaca]